MKTRSGVSAVSAVVLMGLALVFAVAPVAAGTTLSESERVVKTATAQVGDRYLFASNGPNTFDCSGLIYFSFKQNGLADRIGGKRRTVKGYYDYFRARGKADKVVGKPGDLIIWGRNAHMGIYLGNGMAVSTLVNPYGVKIHPVTGYIGMGVKAYLHIGLQRPGDPAPTPSTSPSPSPSASPTAPPTPTPTPAP
ncbi:MAG TPA: NlpC/P60 family protein [Candidatus Limnocylindrales bacterium]|nr:NlpC/P60 family protein [Candidatus Limnocylindrales bacterium]